MSVPEESSPAIPDPFRKGSGHLRVSDQERDQVIEQLNESAGYGRLTLDELEERIEAAFAAKTGSELEVLVRDLPVGQDKTAAAAAAPSRRKPRRWLVALLGGSTVRGRFRAADTINSISVMGGDEVDLREAEIEGSELVINAFALMGGSDFYLPDTVDVSVEGFSLMGGTEERGSTRAPRPGAPLVRIRCFALMGGATIWRLPSETRGMRLKEARKVARDAERGRGRKHLGH
jgi:hypothetical protein